MQTIPAIGQINAQNSIDQLVEDFFLKLSPKHIEKSLLDSLGIAMSKDINDYDGKTIADQLWVIRQVSDFVLDIEKNWGGSFDNPGKNGCVNYEQASNYLFDNFTAKDLKIGLFDIFICLTDTKEEPDLSRINIWIFYIKMSIEFIEICFKIRAKKLNESKQKQS